MGALLHREGAAEVTRAGEEGFQAMSYKYSYNVMIVSDLLPEDFKARLRSVFPGELSVTVPGYGGTPVLLHEEKGEEPAAPPPKPFKNPNLKE